MAGETGANAGPGLAARFWAFVPAALLLAMLAGWTIMVGLALDDPGFGVEPDYYQKAINWDQRQQQLSENRKLGWQLSLKVDGASVSSTRLVASLKDAGGALLSGARVRAEAFPVARSAVIKNLEFRAKRAGEYEVRLDKPRPGLWEVRLSVLYAARKFTKTVRLDLPARRVEP